MFYQAMYEPLRFAEAMAGLSLVPEELWIIFGAIVVFWFGGKFISKEMRNISPPSVEELRALLQLRREFKEEFETVEKKEGT